jgi:hypothetical protein
VTANRQPAPNITAASRTELAQHQTERKKTAGGRPRSANIPVCRFADIPVDERRPAFNAGITLGITPSTDHPSAKIHALFHLNGHSVRRIQTRHRHLARTGTLEHGLVWWREPERSRGPAKHFARFRERNLDFLFLTMMTTKTSLEKSTKT